MTKKLNPVDTLREGRVKSRARHHPRGAKNLREALGLQRLVTLPLLCKFGCGFLSVNRLYNGIRF